MHKEEIYSSYRITFEKIRRERDEWRAISIFLLIASCIMNAVLCGAIVYFDSLHAAEVSAYQKDLEYAYAVRNQAIQELGKAFQQSAIEQITAHDIEDGYDVSTGYNYVGKCKITYYCPCSKCCGENSDGLTATGIPATSGVIAVDPDIIPLGSTVIIGGHRYLAADTGGAIKGMRVDICVSDHLTALSNGVSTADVWVVENG